MPKRDINSLTNRLASQVLRAGVLDDILDDLGFDYKFRVNKKEGMYVGPCPIHGGVDPEHCVVYASDKIIWRCWSANCHDNDKNIKPNLVGFVRACLSTREGHDIGFNAAVQYIENFTSGHKLGLVVQSKTVPLAKDQHECPPNPKPVALVQTPDDFIREHQLRIPSHYFERDRKFSRSILKKLMVGYSDSQKRVVFPIFSDDGKSIVGFIGRSHRPVCPRCHLCHYESVEKDCKWSQQRWKVPKGFEISHHLYAFHLALQSGSPYIILTEGIPDALRCLEAGHPAVACFGLELSPVQEEKLIGLGKRIILGFDNDPDGKRGAARIMREIHSDDVYSLSVPAPNKDLGDMPAREVKELVNQFIARIEG